LKSIDIPLYTSKATKRSIGNEYCIYADRIELRCRFPFFNKILIIKKGDFISIDIFKPPAIRTTFWALKLEKEFVSKVNEIFKLGNIREGLKDII